MDLNRPSRAWMMDAPGGKQSRWQIPQRSSFLLLLTHHLHDLPLATPSSHHLTHSSSSKNKQVRMINSTLVQKHIYKKKVTSREGDRSVGPGFIQSKGQKIKNKKTKTNGDGYGDGSNRVRWYDLDINNRSANLFSCFKYVWVFCLAVVIYCEQNRRSDSLAILCCFSFRIGGVGGRQKSSIDLLDFFFPLNIVLERYRSSHRGRRKSYEGERGQHV